LSPASFAKIIQTQIDAILLVGSKCNRSGGRASGNGLLLGSGVEMRSLQMKASISEQRSQIGSIPQQATSRRPRSEASRHILEAQNTKTAARTGHSCWQASPKQKQKYPCCRRMKETTPWRERSMFISSCPWQGRVPSSDLFLVVLIHLRSTQLLWQSLRVRSGH